MDIKGKPKRRIPFGFALEALHAVEPRVQPMFGCFALYVGEKMMFFLRDKPDDDPHFNGLSLATAPEHAASLRREFRSVREYGPFGFSPEKWLLFDPDHPSFEEDVLRACELISERDPRIGRLPDPRKLRRKKGDKVTR